MSLPYAVAIGLAGNAMSKKIVGSDEVSVGRTLVATGSGAVIGAVTTGGIVVGATAVGVTSVALVATPVVVPLAVVSALVAGIASLFD